MKYLAIATTFILLGFAVNVAISKNEVIECMKWKEQAQTLAEFYLTQWQVNQCEAHNITISL